MDNMLTYGQREARAREAVEEAGRILSGGTIPPTKEHLLELRNVIAGAYRLVDKAKNNQPIDPSELRQWQRRAHPILDARVGGL